MDSYKTIDQSKICAGHRIKAQLKNGPAIDGVEVVKIGKTAITIASQSMPKILRRHLAGNLVQVSGQPSQGAYDRMMMIQPVTVPTTSSRGRKRGPVVRKNTKTETKTKTKTKIDDLDADALAALRKSPTALRMAEVLACLQQAESFFDCAASAKAISNSASDQVLNFEFVAARIAVESAIASAESLSSTVTLAKQALDRALLLLENQPFVQE